MNPNQPYDVFAEQAKELSDLFFKIEGRRPRVLVTGVDDQGQTSLHEICSLFADLGCDADMSPRSHAIKDLVRQYIENDSDIIVACSEKQPQKAQLLELGELIRDYNSEAILVLYTLKNYQETGIHDRLQRWIVFNKEMNKNETGLKVLQKLLNAYEKR